MDLRRSAVLLGNPTLDGWNPILIDLRDMCEALFDVPNLVGAGCLKIVRMSASLLKLSHTRELGTVYVGRNLPRGRGTKPSFIDLTAKVGFWRNGSFVRFRCPAAK